jgi:glucokinase
LKPNPSGKFLVGVDLGGTNVRAAVTDKEGHILGDARRPSLAMEGPDITIPEIIGTIQDALKAAGTATKDVCGVGFGVPGRHKSKEGIVLWNPNFKGWDGIQFLAPVQDALGLAAWMDNDVNVAALGEFRFGAGRGVNSMVMMTLGTGVGGGIILDGKLWQGANEGGGEIGHQVIQTNGPECSCHRFGHLESLAGRDSIVERARRKILMGRKTVLSEWTKPDFFDVTPAMIAKAAGEGDKVALEVMDETGYYVGIGASNAINFLNPEMVVIGGGISQAGPVLWDPIMRTVRANALIEALEVCRVVPSALGDDAGVLGGAVLAAVG